MSLTERQPAHVSLTQGDVMTSGEVAALLRIPKSTVEEWARRGRIPNHKHGRRRFYVRSEIAAWLTSDTG